MPIQRFLWELPKPMKGFLISLWLSIAAIITPAISQWVHESLHETFNTPQALISSLSTKIISLGDILWLLAVFSIPVFVIYSVYKDNRLRIQKQAGKDLSEFIYDIFESDLDDSLIKIVEDSLNTNGNNFGPECILEKLCQSHAYFDFYVAAISLHCPDKLGKYLYPIASFPPLTIAEREKGALTFNIDNNNDDFDSIGLAGFSYKSKELVKIYFNQDHHAIRTNESETSQLTEEPFYPYRNIGKNEIISFRSIAAVPLLRKHKGQTEILGVMCVNSSDVDTFKSQKHDENLTKAARCLAIAIEIQDLLKELN